MQSVINLNTIYMLLNKIRVALWAPGCPMVNRALNATLNCDSTANTAKSTTSHRSKSGMRTQQVAAIPGEQWEVEGWGIMHSRSGPALDTGPKGALCACAVDGVQSEKGSGGVALHPPLSEWSEEGVK